MIEVALHEEFTHARWGSWEGEGSPETRAQTRMLRYGAIGLAAEVRRLRGALEEILALAEGQTKYEHDTRMVDVARAALE